MALTDLGGGGRGPAGSDLPSLSITGPVATAEGSGRDTQMVFTVTRSGDTSLMITCRWAVVGVGTAPARAADFSGGVLPNGTLLIPAGATSATITVSLSADTEVEPDERFAITLIDAQMAVPMTQASATATIADDDMAAVTQRIIAANRTDLPTARVTFAQNTTARRLHHASPQGQVSNLQTVDVGFYLSGADQMLYDLPAAFTIKRFIEYPLGSFTAVTWNGSASVAVTPGSVMVSDPMPVSLPAGAAFFERTVILSATPNEMPTVQLPAGSATLGLPDGKVIGDRGNSGTVAADNSINSFGACVMLGDVAAAGARGFLVIGDSIAFGQGDVSGTGAKGGSGWIARALDPLYPYAKIACPGQGAAAMASIIDEPQFNQLLSAIGYTDVIKEHGINDLRLGRSPSQLQADLQALYNRHMGKRVYQTTLTPRANSSNGYVDATGQTPRTDGTMAMLASVNAAIRAMPAGVSAVIDAADAAMSARDSGVWGGPFPPVLDGTHPTSPKAAAMAAALAPSLDG